jgi:DNA-binding MarR family transcriptional regulator
MTGSNLIISEIIDALRRIFAALEGSPGTALCGIDMTGRQMVALLLINEHGPLTVSRLAALMSLKMSAVSACLNRVEQLGLISRSHGTVDRRVVTLSLTPAGVQTVGAVLAKMNHFLDAMALHDIQRLEAIRYSLDCLMDILVPEPEQRIRPSAAPIIPAGRNRRGGGAMEKRSP